jgi:hypothetical protein
MVLQEIGDPLEWRPILWWEGVESVAFERGGWDSTTDTAGQADLSCSPIGIACRSVRLPLSDEAEVGLGVA